MRVRAGLLILMVATTGSATTGDAQSAPPACSSGTDQMTPFDSTRVASLAGAYDLVMVDTTSMRGSARRHVGRLTIWLQDTGPSRQASMARQTPDRKFLVGRFEAAPPDTGEMWARMGSRAPDMPGGFWSDGFFRLGEFGPKAGISLYFRMDSPSELKGLWTSHPGISVVVDFTGDREPDVAGYFCARRVTG